MSETQSPLTNLEVALNAIYDGGCSGAVLECTSCQAYVAVARLIAELRGLPMPEEVVSWDRRTAKRDRAA